MALREKFGRLVLLEQTDSDPLGDEYLAARLGPAGLDRLVSVLRFSPAVSGHAEASKRLVDEARLVSQVQNPGLVRVLGVGRVGQSFYVSTELMEGRTVRAVLRLSSEEGFPFAVDHALMIASRAAAGLEYLHGRKDESGHRLVHGLLTPGRLVVAFDGEVKVKGLGLWRALGATELLAPEERSYLAPEQASGTSEPRSDVYALGLVLLEALCGQPPDGSDPLERIAAARIASPGGEPAPLPKPLASLLRRALAREPSARFAGIAEMRKAIDVLLFSGDFTPTTFDLAFFMHTLFRDQVERDARAIEEARGADYQSFLSQDAAPPVAPTSAQDAAPPVASTSAQTEPVDAHSPAPDATDVIGAIPTAVPVVTAPEAPQAHDTPAPQGVRHAPGPDSSAARHARVARETAAREAAAKSALPATAPRRGVNRSLWLALGIVGAVVVGGGARLALRRGAAARGGLGGRARGAGRGAGAHARARGPRRAARAREGRGGVARGRRGRPRARAAGGGRRAHGGSRRDRACAGRGAQARPRRAGAQAAGGAAAAGGGQESRGAAAAAAAQAALATPPPTPLPTPTPAQALSSPSVEQSPAEAAATRGPTEESALPQPLAAATTPAAALAPTPASTGAARPAAPPANGAAAAPPGAQHAPADPSDPAVRPPGLISEDRIPYPARAISRRIATVVVVRALVDETGRVVEAAIVQASGQPPDYGFDQAALNRVKSRKYRPARQNDVPVPIWVVVRVEFRPPPLR